MKLEIELTELSDSELRTIQHALTYYGYHGSDRSYDKLADKLKGKKMWVGE